MSAKVIIGIGLVVFIIAGLIVLRLKNRKVKTPGAASAKDAAPFAKETLWKRQEKIGDYFVKYSMYIGHKDIALGENPGADKDERYMCLLCRDKRYFRALFRGGAGQRRFCGGCKGVRTARSRRSRGNYSGKRKEPVRRSA